MKPVPFKEQNSTLAKDQKPYLPLPCYKETKTAQGEVISCWRLSFWERMKALVTGRVWLCILTFNLPPQPVRLTVNKWDLLNQEFFRRMSIRKEKAKPAIKPLKESNEKAV